MLAALLRARTAKRGLPSAFFASHTPTVTALDGCAAMDTIKTPSVSLQVQKQSELGARASRAQTRAVGGAGEQGQCLNTVNTLMALLAALSASTALTSLDNAVELQRVQVCSLFELD